MPNNNESRLDRIERLLEALIAQELRFREDIQLAAVRLAITKAPPDDEQLTPGAQAALAEALAEFHSGAPAIPHEDILREFGLPG
jgi:hypothetical protein